jgi:hypothetical protein
MAFFKLCPKCDKEIKYKNKRNFVESVKKNIKCKSCCVHKLAWLRMLPREERLAHKRNLKLQGMYGIDAEKWNEMFLQQNGCCKICNRHQTEFKNKLSVDHCHKTGKVRGLLCNDCNRGLGSFKDNTELIKIAINYLNEN